MQITSDVFPSSSNFFYAKWVKSFFCYANAFKLHSDSRKDVKIYRFIENQNNEVRKKESSILPINFLAHFCLTYILTDFLIHQLLLTRKTVLLCNLDWKPDNQCYLHS